IGIFLFLFVATCGLPSAYNNLPSESNLSNCLIYQPRFSYFSEYNECLSFIYTGCGGNDNNFPTRELCEAKCKE
ncbi:hypothetical protein KR009_001810, partial [Drosophila setifemur]